MDVRTGRSRAFDKELIHGCAGRRGARKGRGVKLRCSTVPDAINGIRARKLPVNRTLEK